MKILSVCLSAKIVRFLLVGIFGAIIELGLFSVLFDAGLGVVPANVVAFHVAFATCFFLHFIYTHSFSISDRRFFIRGFMKYAALMYGQLGFGTLLLWLLIDKVGCIAEIAKLLQIAIVTPFGYLIQKLLIFRRQVL